MDPYGSISRPRSPSGRQTVPAVLVIVLAAALVGSLIWSLSADASSTPVDSGLGTDEEGVASEPPEGPPAVDRVTDEYLVASGTGESSGTGTTFGWELRAYYSHLGLCINMVLTSQYGWGRGGGCGFPTSGGYSFGGGTGADPNGTYIYGAVPPQTANVIVTLDDGSVRNVVPLLLGADAEVREGFFVLVEPPGAPHLKHVVAQDAAGTALALQSVEGEPFR